MRYVNCIIMVISLFFLVQSCFAYDDDFDWTYELSDRAKEIYKNKEVQIPCSDITKLLNEGKHWAVYRAIRDAGIFKDANCDNVILKEIERIKKIPIIYGAYFFYRIRLGDNFFIENLIVSFDKEARMSGDHYTVELFGFLSDWEKSGCRLIRHAKYADGAASELLCSAILWRRFFYGEDEFKKNWFEIGKKEGVDDRILQFFYDTCK